MMAILCILKTKKSIGSGLAFAVFMRIYHRNR